MKHEHCVEDLKASIPFSCLLYQLYFVFEGQIFITKNSSCYGKRMIKRKISSLQKLSEFILLRS
jgi:hypothetical protein